MALTEQTAPPAAKLEDWNRDLATRTAQERVRARSAFQQIWPITTIDQVAGTPTLQGVGTVRSGQLPR